MNDGVRKLLEIRRFSDPQQKKKKSRNSCSFRTFLVRVSRFELEASWTPFKRDTKLRHTRIFYFLRLRNRISLFIIPLSAANVNIFFPKKPSFLLLFLLTKLSPYGKIILAFGLSALSHTERWLSGRKHRSWKPAMWKHPWVRIPLSPPNRL